jgi:hypothetical protein
MREIVESLNHKKLEEAAKKKAAPGGGIKINKEVIPDVGEYLNEYFWQDMEYRMVKQRGLDPDKAKALVTANQEKIKQIISKMAANTNFSISPDA